MDILSRFFYDPDNQMLYDLSGAANAIVAVYTLNNTVADNISTGYNPSDIVYVPSNDEIYVVDSGSNEVLALNG